MLTYDQAAYFLDNILQMPLTWRALVKNKPLEFLTTYMKRHIILVPFQNADMAIVEEEHRKYPSEQDIIDIGLSGRGGCCIHLNYFSMLVFQAVGLDSFVVRGDHYFAPIAGTHCMVMVAIHSPQDRGTYLVEVGGVLPMRQPVPMDSDRLPLRIVEAAGFPYEFRQLSPNWIGIFRLEGGLLGGKFTDKTELLRTYWEMKPRALWEFDYPMLTTFVQPENSSLLRVPYMKRFFTNTEVKTLFPQLSQQIAKSKVTPEGLVPPKTCRESKSFQLHLPNSKTAEKGTIPRQHASIDGPNHKGSDLDNPTTFVLAYKRRIVIGNAESRQLVQNYESYDEMLGPLSKYFPMIPLPVLTLAMEKFKPYDAPSCTVEGIL